MSEAFKCDACSSLTEGHPRPLEGLFVSFRSTRYALEGTWLRKLNHANPKAELCDRCLGTVLQRIARKILGGANEQPVEELTA